MSIKTNPVIESIQRVVSQALHVEVDLGAIEKMCAKLVQKGIHIPEWDSTFHYAGHPEKTVAYLLVLDTINFCFWPPLGQAKWEISYGTRTASGYYGLAAALKRAMEEGIPIHRASYLAEMQHKDLQYILRGRGTLQLMEKRLENLNELGICLETKFQGNPLNLIEAANKSALSLVQLLRTHLASFRDEATYRGEKVFFYKRAQILAADIHGAFNGEKWGVFEDIEALTAFADYKLPQVLRQLGIIRYAPSLETKIDQLILIPPGSTEEVEIRAQTIWAVELICRKLADLGKHISPFQLDWILWNLGQSDRFRQKPYHRTVTIFY